MQERNNRNASVKSILVRAIKRLIYFEINVGKEPILSRRDQSSRSAIVDRQRESFYRLLNSDKQNDKYQYPSSRVRYA